jgi:hypothetical protein
MSTFWKPLYGGSLVSQLWARCDLCRFSGPIERFQQWERSDDTTEVCDHDWCGGDRGVQGQLEENGWRRVGPPATTERHRA